MTDRTKEREVRLHGVAARTGEGIESLRSRTEDLPLGWIPKDIPNAYLRLELVKATSSGLRDDGTPWIDTADGWTLEGLPQPDRILGIARCLGEFRPSAIDPACLLLARDIVARLRTPRIVDLLTRESTNVIEVGAFHGLKAMAFQHRMKQNGFPTGRVMAIEMMPSNHGVLSRNVTLNGLEDRVVPVLAGAWKENVHTQVAWKGRQQSSVEPIDDRSWSGEKKHEVELARIDELMDRHDLDHADLVNIQVNGAECEAIEGMSAAWDRVDLVRVVSPYSRDGSPLLPEVLTRLEEAHCEVLAIVKRQVVAAPRRVASSLRRHVRRWAENPARHRS